MVDEIEPAALRELLESGDDVRVVDIRGTTAFEAGHIPGSEHVPMDRLPAKIGRFDGADHVVTVCPHGEASVQAGRLIQAYEGTETTRVESLAGGLSAWEGPLEDGPDEESAGAEPAEDAPF